MESNQKIEETKTLDGTLKSNSRNSLIISASILLTGILIATAVFYSGSGVDEAGNAENGAVIERSVQYNEPKEIPGSAIRPVSQSDHVRGDINAPVKCV